MSHSPGPRPNPRVWNRRLHRWGAVAIGIPFLVVIVTGLVLQVKKQVRWVQPAERQTEARIPTVPYSVVMDNARRVAEAGIQSWEDIDKVDVRPGKGMLKLIARNRWEIQMDIATGEVLQVAFRRSDWIETLHDMSWIHGSAKLWLGVPIGLIVLGLWLTGGYMWLVHLRGKRRMRDAGRRRADAVSPLLLLLAATPLAAQQAPATVCRPVVTPHALPPGDGPMPRIGHGQFTFLTAAVR